jgi:hypothetical protein
VRVAGVEKSVCTHADFDRMGWHDAAVHAVAVEPASPHPGRLLLDLDYIIEWIDPTPPETSYEFWLCPATLAFDAAADLRADLSRVGLAFEPAIDQVVRSEPYEHGIRDSTIAGHEFTITLRARGFAQYLPRRPTRARGQRLSVQDRGGISFEEPGFSQRVAAPELAICSAR